MPNIHLFFINPSQNSATRPLVNSYSIISNTSLRRHLLVFPRIDDSTTCCDLTWRGPLFSRKLFITCPYSRRLLYAITSAQHLYFPHKWCSLYESPHITRSSIHKYPYFVPAEHFSMFLSMDIASILH